MAPLTRISYSSFKTASCESDKRSYMLCALVSSVREAVTELPTSRRQLTKKEVSVAKEFDTVWQRIVKCTGLQFSAATGLEFSYEAKGQTLRPNRTRYNLSRSEFEKAWGLLPSATLSQLNRAVRGPSYVIAILTDPRVSANAGH
jgi:hypothetical protein